MALSVGAQMDANSQTNLVRNCVSKLISHLGDKYPANEHAVYKDRSSLINQLDHGLHRALTPTSQERPCHVVTSQVRHRRWLSLTNVIN